MNVKYEDLKFEKFTVPTILNTLGGKNINYAIPRLCHFVRKAR